MRRAALFGVWLLVGAAGCGPSQPMKEAVVNGALKDVRKHVDAGYDVNARIQATASDAKILHYAARKYARMGDIGANHEAVLALLVASGADLDGRDKEQATPLHEACYQGGPRVVELLLGYGADPNAADRSGRTPLHRAAMKHHPACCRILLEHGANPNAQDSRGHAPLHLAAGENSQDHFERAKETVDTLLAGGADLKLADHGGIPPARHTFPGSRIEPYLRSLSEGT